MRMKTQIVVAGGGAGGLELVTRLGRALGRDQFDVILIERNHTHIWKPLLHEVAAGSLDANLDEVGYRSHGHLWRYRFYYGSLETIDRKNRIAVVAPILDDDGAELIGRHRIRYDYLVIAVGSVSNDFSTPGVADYCLFLENREQADRFRLKLLNHCLRVSRALSADPSAEAHVDIAIVGGGATGVELAAELYNAASALKHYGLEVFDESRLRVTLVEAGPRILPALPEKLATAAREELEALGVHVLENTAIVEVTAKAMRTKSGEEIPFDISVWAAGVRGPDILSDLDGLESTRNNQLVVRPTLQTTRDERIFAIGDCCFCKLRERSAPFLRARRRPTRWLEPPTATFAG
jgi:NADH dehydrogenase